jgi:hypothetical protein
MSTCARPSSGDGGAEPSRGENYSRRGPRELKRIALVDIGEAFDELGRLKPMKDIPPDVRRAIAGVDVEMLFEGRGESRYHSGDVVKVKFWSKPDTLVALGRHLKLFTDKLEVKVDESFADALKAARERAQQR